MLATRRRRYIPKSKIYYLPVPGSSSITPTTLTRSVTINGNQSEDAPSGTLWNRVELNVRVPSGLPIVLTHFYLGISSQPPVSSSLLPLSSLISISNPASEFTLEPQKVYFFIGDTTLTIGTLTFPVLRFQIYRNFTSTSTTVNFINWSSCYYYSITPSTTSSPTTAYVFASSTSSPPFVDLDIDTPLTSSVQSDSSYLSTSYFSLDLS